MKKLPRNLLAALTLGLLVVSAPALAQTPDDEPPALEGICDGLQGLTPGLYGLCVAYCEAQDADFLSPGDDPSAMNPPHRNILQNYNKLKTEADPSMPCVQQPDDCPCWTEEQLLTVLPPGTNPDANFENACENSPVVTAIENVENGLGVPPAIQLLTFEFSTGLNVCNVANTDYPGGPPQNQMAVTDAELAGCKSSLIAHANANKIDGTVWDCF